MQRLNVTQVELSTFLLLYQQVCQQYVKHLF